MSQKAEETRTGYRLTRGNVIYTAIGMPIGVLAYFLTGDVYSIPQFFGSVLGHIVGFIAIPALFGYLVWMMSGRQHNGGSITYALVFTLVLLGQLGAAANQSAHKRNISNMQSDLRDMGKALEDASDEDIEELTEQRFEKIGTHLDALAKTSKGIDNTIVLVIKQHSEKDQSHATAWMAAFDSILDERILDPSYLTTQEEFDHQRSVLTQYVEDTKQYKTFYVTQLDTLAKSMRMVDIPQPHIDAAVNSAAKNVAIVGPALERHMDAHIEYGAQMLAWLKLLESNQQDWRIVEGTLDITGAVLEVNYDLLVEQLMAAENAVNQTNQLLNEANAKMLQAIGNDDTVD